MLFSFLKDGPKQRNEIVKHLKGYKISESKVNRMLNENDGKRIFKFKKKGKVYYRLNDLPLEAQIFISFVDSYKEQDALKEILNRIKYDIITLYPKMSIMQILSGWEAVCEAASKGNISLFEIFEKAKENLR